MKKKQSSLKVVILVTAVLFILLFTYSSLNLKNIDYGYEMQELIRYEKALNEEIDKLHAEKARLLNLNRVEDIALRKLGYQYPKPHQFIRVFED